MHITTGTKQCKGSSTESLQIHSYMCTRQMIIIVGGEPELCCGMARLSKRVGVCARPYALRMRKYVLSRMRCACTCCALCLCEVTGKKN